MMLIPQKFLYISGIDSIKMDSNNEEKEFDEDDYTKKELKAMKKNDKKEQEKIAILFFYL